MTGNKLRKAREILGHRWGLGRPLKMAELGRALRLGGRDPGESIRNYESDRTPISGPVAVAVEMWLAGAPVPGGVDVIKANAGPLPFAAWLKRQAVRDDAVGDLARDARDDLGFPSWPGTVASVRGYLEGRAGDPALQALRRAITEFEGVDPGKI